MSMSKQDYVDIAAQFRIVRTKNALTTREKIMLSELASRLASGFRLRNTAFNTDRFLDACHAYKDQDQY